MCVFCGGQVIFVWEVRCLVNWFGDVGWYRCVCAGMCRYSVLCEH